MKLVPGETHRANFAELPVELLDDCLARADLVSLSLFGLRVSAAPGSKTRLKILQSLEAIAPARVVGFYTASSWLGTTTRSSLVVLFALDERLRAAIRAAETPFWSAGDWEDLAVYHGNRVLLWTCTHEREGVVFGSHAKLSRMGLAPSPIDAIEVRAEPLDVSIQQEPGRISPLRRGVGD